MYKHAHNVNIHV